MVTLDEMKAKQENIVKERERKLAQKQLEKEREQQRQLEAKQAEKNRQKRQVTKRVFEQNSIALYNSQFKKIFSQNC